MKICYDCNTKLGFFSSKSYGDGTRLCNTCYDSRVKKRQREEQIEKENNNKTMIEYITKYLSGRDIEINAHILGCYKNIRNLFDKNSLERVTNHFDTLLVELEHSNKSGMTSFEIDEVLESKKAYVGVLNFLDDLEKMYKLFKKKSIKTNYEEILSMFAEISKQNVDKTYDKVLEPAYKRISKKVSSNPTAENIIKEFVSMQLDIELDVEIISRLLNKFNFEYNDEDVAKILSKSLEEIELDEFEQDFKSTKFEIGDFEELTGYEFESYLENLFTLLGYTVIQTALSGDQGADLIISKDGEKSVVQAKKYTGNVSNSAIQEIVAAKNHYNAQNAIVVTNSQFTKSAIDLALSNDVELWDGLKLKNVVSSLKNKKEKKEFTSNKFYNIKGDGIQQIEIECPFCEEKFECDVDASLLHDFEVKCPNCEISITVESTSITWNCEHCSEVFDTKKEAEKHEDNCEFKNN